MTSLHQLRETMVDTQVRPADVTKFPVIDAMRKTPRECYLPEHLQNIAYLGENIHLSSDRVVLDPRTSAKMLDALDIQPGEVILDIGCALGYSTALLACLAEVVIAVEEKSDWAESAQKNLSSRDLDHTIVHIGPLDAGAIEHGPYNVIIIEGAIEVLPNALCQQLALGGRIIAIFHDGYIGAVRLGKKVNDTIVWRFLFNASAPVLRGFAKSKHFVF